MAEGDGGADIPASVEGETPVTLLESATTQVGDVTEASAVNEGRGEGSVEDGKNADDAPGLKIDGEGDRRGQAAISTGDAAKLGGISAVEQVAEERGADTTNVEKTVGEEGTGEGGKAEATERQARTEPEEGNGPSLGSESIASQAQDIRANGELEGEPEAQATHRHFPDGGKENGLQGEPLNAAKVDEAEVPSPAAGGEVNGVLGAEVHPNGVALEAEATEVADEAVGIQDGGPHVRANDKDDVTYMAEQQGEDEGEERGDKLSIRKAKEAERRRRRRKQKKTKKGDSVMEESNGATPTEPQEENSAAVEVEYVTVKPQVDGEGFEEFLKIFEKFSTTEVGPQEESEATEKEKEGEEDQDEEEDEDEKEKGLSNKEKKLRRRMKVAELKQICARPDVVEVWDSTAQDPRLLVYLKAYRNSVPVPRHWSQKRKYLQGKRGIEKPPWQLPDFIAATGIEKLRQAYQEKEESKKMKQKQRDKMQPKMGKMDIDYQVLHDAFFKYQTKPKLTYIGDVYYEGKEFEMKDRAFKPGQLSEDLKAALGMTESTSPPPWLINMQRYGPPPSYPQLKIPGLSAPLPSGAQFGFQPGGWGQPPVDERGRPIYGDVFGVQQQQEEGELYEDEEPLEKSRHWGDLEEEEEEEEEEEGGEEEEGEEEEGEEQLREKELVSGMESVDTMTTTPAGMETPDIIDLRKSQRKDSVPATVQAEKPLYTVLEQREERIAPGTLLGTAHTYVLPTETASVGVGAPLAAPPAAGAAPPAPSSALVPAVGKKLDPKKSDRVEVTLRPEELEGLDDAQLAAKFQAAREAEKSLELEDREDFSDLVAEREKKRKKKQAEKEKATKKQKDFKF